MPKVPRVHGGQGHSLNTTYLRSAIAALIFVLVDIVQTISTVGVGLPASDLFKAQLENPLLT